LDLKEGKAIDALGSALFERFGRVDVLVGNAAVLGVLSPVSHLDDKIWDEVMAINVNANWRLIRTLEPLLKQSSAGRAVFLTAGTARTMRAYWGVYAISKAALECMVGTWAAELKITNVKANVLSPGPIRTAMRARAMPGEDPMTLTPPEDLAPFITAMVAPDYAETGMLYDFRARTTTPIAIAG
jgi:NAD(P)-dependent dehydrogenase (short-subunit alcohol dehydrogenase family)